MQSTYSSHDPVHREKHISILFHFLSFGHQQDNH